MTGTNQTNPVNNPCLDRRFDIAPRIADYIHALVIRLKACPLTRELNQVTSFFMWIIPISADRKIAPNIYVFQLQLGQRFAVAR